MSFFSSGYFIFACNSWTLLRSEWSFLRITRTTACHCLPSTRLSSWRTPPFRARFFTGSAVCYRGGVASFALLLSSNGFSTLRLQISGRRSPGKLRATQFLRRISKLRVDCILRVRLLYLIFVRLPGATVLVNEVFITPMMPPCRNPYQRTNRSKTTTTAAFSYRRCSAVLVLA